MIFDFVWYVSLFRPNITKYKTGERKKEEEEAKQQEKRNRIGIQRALKYAESKRDAGTWNSIHAYMYYIDILSIS